jgi:deoxyribonuclease-4
MTGRFLGVHAEDAGGIAMAVRRAAAAGARALQLFSAPPAFYNERTAVRPERIERFRAALTEAGIEPRHVLVHAPYVLNAASPEASKAERSRVGLAQELRRSAALGAGACCFHPGSAGDGDPGEACDRVGDAILHALESVPESDAGTRLLIENTAGAGRTVGRSPEEIARMLARVRPSLRRRTGYGLDTCHLFASGYDIASSPESLRSVLERFERATGERPAFVHLNDSRHPLGSNRDRHALLGEGTIGLEPFRWLLADERSAGIPLVLETPHERSPVGEDDPSPDPADVRMLGLLWELLPQGGSGRDGSGG